MSFEPGRKYSREEIQEIFRRAAERQSNKREADDGLTLNELQKIGDESGIPPEYIAAAARDLDRPAREQAPVDEEPETPRGVERFYGMKASARIEQTVPGRVGDEAWADIVRVLESVFQNKGEVSEAGPLREWRLASSFGFDMRAFGSGSGVNDWLKLFDSMSDPTKGPVTVEVSPEGDRTRIEMSYAMPNGRLWEGPGFIAMFLSIAAVVTTVFGFVGEPMILIAPLIMLLLSVGLGGSVLVSHRNEILETKERMRKAMKRIEQMQTARHAGQSRNAQEEKAQEEKAQEENAQEETVQEKNPASRPLLDVEDEPAAEESASDRSSRRSRA